MASKFTNLLFHVIFSTKGREPVINADLREQLPKYAAGIIRSLNGIPKAIGCVKDHIHILCLMPPNKSISDTIREIKSNSSRWINEESGKGDWFHWQAGYAAFTVSESLLDSVRQYIGNQEEHHRVHTFEEEYRAFLLKHQIPIDERYIWG